MAERDSYVELNRRPGQHELVVAGDVVIYEVESPGGDARMETMVNRNAWVVNERDGTAGYASPPQSWERPTP